MAIVKLEIRPEPGHLHVVLSGAFSLYAFVYSAFGLVAGRLTDRWGPRVVDFLKTVAAKVESLEAVRS